MATSSITKRESSILEITIKMLLRLPNFGILRAHFYNLRTNLVLGY